MSNYMIQQYDRHKDKLLNQELAKKETENQFIYKLGNYISSLTIILSINEVKKFSPEEIKAFFLPHKGKFLYETISKETDRMECFLAFYWANLYLVTKDISLQDIMELTNVEQAVIGVYTVGSLFQKSEGNNWFDKLSDKGLQLEQALNNIDLIYIKLYRKKALKTFVQIADLVVGQIDMLNSRSHVSINGDVGQLTAIENLQCQLRQIIDGGVVHGD